VIKPLGTVGQGGNILRHGDTGDERSPMLSFYPGSTRLTVRSSTTKNNNDGANPDPNQSLAMNKWTHVAFTHKSGELKVYYNTELVATTTDIAAPLYSAGIVYACGTDQPCANALVFDIRYFPSALDIDHIAMAAQDSTAKMTAQVSSSSSSASQSASASKSSSAASGSGSSSSAAPVSSSAAPASGSASASVAASGSASRFRTVAAALDPQ